MAKEVTYIISSINKALSFEWIVEHLDNKSFSLHFILLNKGNTELEKFLTEKKIAVDRIEYRGKKDMPLAIIKTIQILKKRKTKIVHTHLFDANIVGLLSAWICRVPKRIYTRHHSNYHHIYFPKAVKYDKLSNFLSTDIVAISQVVKKVLVTDEKVSPDKIHLIHHGFLLDKFYIVNKNEIQELKKKYNPDSCHPVIGVISRYIELKGIQYIIQAFKELLTLHPNARLILANAGGSYQNEIKKLLSEIPSKNVCEIVFEPNIYALYHLFDIYVHAPVGSDLEAFGQTYIEALAAGIPSIFTLSGIANEFIINNQNAVVVPYKNSQEIFKAIEFLLNNPEAAAKISVRGKNDVKETFELKKMILSLEKLYDS
ncbi:MAG: glycosyltransferase family 4 protein [Bacteroidetes bacterium]|nr:glycosyltransferase family 4 protein [Bacteroidota bacterium]